MVRSYQPFDSLIKAIDTVCTRHGVHISIGATIFDSSDAFFRDNLINLSSGNTRQLFIKKRKTFKFGKGLFSMLIDKIKRASLCVCNVSMKNKSVMLYINLNAPMKQVISDLIFAVPMAISVHLPLADGKIDQKLADEVSKELNTLFFDISVKDIEEYANEIRSLHTDKAEANSE